MPNPFAIAFDTVSFKNKNRRAKLLELDLSTRNYIIFFIPRSGSTLLRTYLRATDQLGRPAEHFLIRKFERHLQNHPAKNLSEYIDLVRRTKVSTNGVFGMQVSWPQLRHINQLTDLISLFEERPACVYLRRKDLLLQAISLVRLWQSGVAHLHAGDLRFQSFAQKPLIYRENEIRRAIRKFAQQEHQLEKYFEKKELKPLRLYYEDVVRDPPKVVKEISDLVGVRLDGGDNPITRELVKLRTNESLIWAEQFRQSQSEFLDYFVANRGTVPPNSINRQAERKTHAVRTWFAGVRSRMRRN